MPPAQQLSGDAFCYCPKTFELLHTSHVPFNTRTGRHALPPNTTLCPPPDVVVQPFKCAVFDKDSAVWCVVPDYRRVMLYSKSTALPVANSLVLGEDLPSDLTASAPVPLGLNSHHRNLWDDACECWRVIPDYAGVPLWHKESAAPAKGIPTGMDLPDYLTPITPPLDGSTYRFDELAQRWDRVASDP